jgi:hypothetical protein
LQGSVGFTLVSFDSEHDTPAVPDIKAYKVYPAGRQDGYKPVPETAGK